VADQALGRRLGRQAPERLDAAAEQVRALAQALEVALVQRLARLDVEHSDRAAARGHRQAGFGDHSRVGLEVVVALADVVDHHLGGGAVGAPDDPGAGRHAVADLPVAAQRGAAQAPAAGEIDGGQQAALGGDMVDDRRRRCRGVGCAVERKAKERGPPHTTICIGARGRTLSA
jgi:hypothetical protein